MKKFLFFCLITVFSFPLLLQAVNVPVKTISKKEATANLSSKDILTLDRKEIEEKIGKKLKLHEKIALKILKKKLKKQAKKNSDQTQNSTLPIIGFSSALGSILFGLFGIISPYLFIVALILALLAVIFSSIAIRNIKRNVTSNKGKGLAISGLIIGLIILGLGLAFGILLLIYAAGCC